MTRAALLLFLATAGTVSAQDPPPDERPIHLPPGETQLFRALLDFRDVKPAENAGDYRNKIVVVYGKPSRLRDVERIQEATSNAMGQGGAVLILSDKLIGLSNDADPVGVKYLPHTATAACLVPATVENRKNCFQGHFDCPFVRSASPQTAVDNPFSGLTRVATNKPGVLLCSREGSAHRFAEFFPDTDYQLHVPAVWARGYQISFSSGQFFPGPSPSRWIALADEDVLSNSLLASKQTDNFVLAVRLVDWLRGPEGRSECLFFEYGKLQPKFDEVKFVTLPDLPGPPVPPIPPLKVISQQLTEFGDRFSDELQTHDRLHHGLVGGDRGYARWLLVLSVLAAGVAFVYLIRRMIAGRQPAPGPALWVHDDGPPGKLLAVLRQEMVRGNNFTAAVTAYIDETFRLAGLPPAGPYPEAPLPVAITGRKVKKVELYKDIAALWAVWRNPPETPIHYAMWRTLEPAAEHVRRLAVKGRWHFAPDFAPPGGAA